MLSNPSLVIGKKNDTPSSIARISVMIADEMMNIWAESQRITKQYPLNGNDANDKKALHYRAENILGPAHPAVKQGQTRGHQHYQSGSRQHKGGICSIHVCS